MQYETQTTLAASTTIEGIGVHSNARSVLELRPAQTNTGIVFECVRNGKLHSVRADFNAVTATEFTTVVGDDHGALCSLAEHVMAALNGLRVDNAVVHLTGSEIPIMDGSAAPIVEAIDKAGLKALDAPREYMQILEPLRVSHGKAVGELRPYKQGLRVEIDIDFEEPIGQQSCTYDVTPKIFREELAPARTFGFMRDVAALWTANFALGASFENAIVIGEGRILNPEGLRFENEFARHKAVDAIGDLLFVGAPMLGHYHSMRGGHGLNHAIVQALKNKPGAWKKVKMPVVAPVMA